MSSAEIILKNQQNGWLIASFACRLGKVAALTTFAIFAIHCSLQNHLDLQSLCLMGGSLVGRYVFKKLHNFASKKSLNAQIKFECMQFLNPALNEITKWNTFVNTVYKIDKFLSIVWNYLFLGRCFTSNRAKNSEILECLDDKIMGDHVIISQKYGRTVSPVVRLDPVGEGLCHGMTLHFAKQYLLGKNINAVMNEFAGGAPREAIVLHGQYDTFFGPCLRKDIFDDNSDSDEIQQMIAEVAGLKREDILKTKDAMTSGCLSELLPKKDGVYEIDFAQAAGDHSTLLIKEGLYFYLFDPNESKLIKAQNVQIILNFLIKEYNFKNDLELLHISELTLLAS